MKMPSRPVSLLLVSRDQNEGNILRLGLQDAMGAYLGETLLVHDPQVAFHAFKQNHPDVLIMTGFPSSYSEALVINARSLEGRRHTGIVVMAPMDEMFDKLAVDHYNAGADDVISSHLSIAILKSKIITVFNHKLAADELRAAVHKLATMNLTDELTGLANMRGFLKKFGVSVKECEKGSHGTAVMMMDLDHFKKVNDSTNHMVGSFVIKSVGHILGESFSSPDFAARYGGDEYIAVLYGDDPIAQMTKVDRVRQAIQRQTFKFQDHLIKITCSAGLCFVPSGFAGRPEDIVKAADAMLYYSKGLGRNVISGMTLRYPIDFNHIGRTHMIDWNTGSDDNTIPRRNNA